MTTFYAVCAVIGGAILLVQFVMTLVGFDGDAEMGGHDFDAGGGLDAGGGHDLGGGHDAGGLDGGAAADHGGHATHGSTWLFSVITFRTMVAALTFFGLAGLASDSAKFETSTTLLIALAAGGAAMYGVFWLMQSMKHLHADGTVRLKAAVGRTGTVYIRIPPRRGGHGKIHLNLQNQTMELQAVTTNDNELPTGATIVVTEILGPDTVEVALAS